MVDLKYLIVPKDDDRELHICYRCSDLYSQYAPIALYSVLVNNFDKYIYVYIITDGISKARWEKIEKVSKSFSNNEVLLIIPDEEDVQRQRVKSRAYHGWGLINISIYYQKYFPHLKKVFNLGIDAFCVGSLDAIWKEDVSNYHLIGSNNRHQKKTLVKSHSAWIGMDIALIHLAKLRDDKITPAKMEDYTIKKLGYIHDEVAYNELCRRNFVNTNYYYVYSGSYLPRKNLNKETRLIDFYNNLKPWEIAIPGYEVFDKYREYYKAVASIVDLEYTLPANKKEAAWLLKNKGKPFVDWFPFAHRFLGEPVYRIIWIFKHLYERVFVAEKGGK